MSLQHNYFELFGLPAQFDVDMKQLSSRYQDLQKALHPDRFANAPDQERRLSLQQAGQVNQGFQVLKDPLERARYLLALQGVMDDSEQVTIRDPEFLEQQMELREQLADIRHAADPVSALLDFMAGLERAIAAQVMRLAQLFAAGSEADLQTARGLVHQLQFLYKVRREAEMLEEALM